MEFVELLSALKEQNKTGIGFQIHLNSGNLDEKAQRNTDVEVGDLYFTHYRMLHDGSILAFYDEGNSNMFIDVKKSNPSRKRKIAKIGLSWNHQK